MNKNPILIKRIYDDYDKHDGFRILVDRLWPRGVSKENAHIDEWAKEVAPSNELRQWFGHVPEKFTEFAKRYRQELESSQAFAELQQLVAKHPNVTLVYGAKDELHNQAVVLQQLLDHK